MRGNDSTACTSCNDDSLEVAGDPAGPCQPPGKNSSSSVSLHPLLYIVCEVIFQYDCTALQLSNQPEIDLGPGCCALCTLSACIVLISDLYIKACIYIKKSM